MANYSWLSSSGRDLAALARRRRKGEFDDISGDLAEDMARHEAPLAGVQKVLEKATPWVQDYLDYNEEDQKRKALAMILQHNLKINDINFAAGRERSSNAIPHKTFIKAQQYRRLAESSMTRETLEALASCDTEIKRLVRRRGLPKQ